MSVQELWQLKAVLVAPQGCRFEISGQQLTQRCGNSRLYLWHHEAVDVVTRASWGPVRTETRSTHVCMLPISHVNSNQAADLQTPLSRARLPTVSVSKAGFGDCTHTHDNGLNGALRLGDAHLCLQIVRQWHDREAWSCG